MQSATIAHILAAHRASKRQAKPATFEAPAVQNKVNPLLMAIARHTRIGARTMLEMARDRDGVVRPWQ